MTRREFFGLRFYKIADPIDGSPLHLCNRDQPHVYSHLTFISNLNKYEVDALLEEVTKAVSGQPVDSEFESDGVENTSVIINPPNITVGGQCTISLPDMKGLLEEWKAFLNT
jgi:hypothetical protein